MASKNRRELVRCNGHSHRSPNNKGSKKEKKLFPKKEVKKEDILGAVKRIISY